ncbi:hypothetical protein BGW80DRAFT_881461 [Lactifluus volemus]|nr:hypothetical protein BGW80DRAFT_881461 [Lactifluus volemus]
MTSTSDQTPYLYVSYSHAHAHKLSVTRNSSGLSGTPGPLRWRLPYSSVVTARLGNRFQAEPNRFQPSRRAKRLET